MNYDLQDGGIRNQIMSGVRRVVVKVGTRLLMDVKGIEPAQRIESLVNELIWLRKQGLDVILVTSGAIGAALRVLEKSRRPKKVETLQAYAALGQCSLMSMYEEASSKHGVHCAQLLLTAADLRSLERHQNVARCVEELLALGLMPVVNENDSVCTDQIKVGDNDTLASLVASMCRADLTVLLTTIDGMREKCPVTGELGDRISVVHEIDQHLLDMAGGTDGNSFSVGGMATKLHAAATSTACGEPLWIAEGTDFAVLRKILACEDVGTVFSAKDKPRMHARQRFIAFFAEPDGELVVDDGAVSAIRDKGKSLLPSGVLGMRGVFAPGSVVCIVDSRRREIGRGIVNFGTVELSKICGAGTDELPALLGREPAATEAVHRDFLVITRRMA